MQQTITPLPASYRDPAGFMFEKDGRLYRQVNEIFRKDFDLFIESGCYDQLIEKKLLIRHTEINENLSQVPGYFKTLLPEKIPFISYPYEWSFDMLKDAALLTLQIAKEVLPFGLVLKDATPFNVQWRNATPVFIDTLSFEKYDPSQPWIAYRQFCENFLSPLLLMHYYKHPFQSLQLAYPDGIPLQLTKSMLPWKSKLSLYTYLHIHLHASIAAKQPVKQESSKTAFSEKKFRSLVESLESLVQTLQWKGKTSTWENYYQEATLRDDYLEVKKNIVVEMVDKLPDLHSGADIGGNEGVFSLVLAQKNIPTITTDFDHTSINKLYLKLKKNNTKILPLVIDVSNPSPPIGVNNEERDSFMQRTQVDICLALALVHHLAIGKNIPFEKIAAFFSAITQYLLIEFVPKTDSKVTFMLQQKKDIYTNYTEEDFTRSFEEKFIILEKKTIANSGRTLYLMKKHA